MKNRNSLVKTIVDELASKDLFLAKQSSVQQFVNDDGQFFTFLCMNEKETFLCRYCYDSEESQILQKEIQVHEHLQKMDNGKGVYENAPFLLQIKATLRHHAFIAVVYEYFDPMEVISLEQLLLARKSQEQDFTPVQLVGLFKNLSEIFGYLQLNGVVMHLVQLPYFLIDKYSLEIRMWNFGLTCQVVGTPWMAVELKDDGVLARTRGQPTANFFDLPPEMQYMQPEMLSPRLRSLFQSEEADFESDLSPYIEFTYSAGMLMLMIATLQVELENNINAEALIYERLKKLSPAIKKIL